MNNIKSINIKEGVFFERIQFIFILKYFVQCTSHTGWLFFLHYCPRNFFIQFKNDCVNVNLLKKEPL